MITASPEQTERAIKSAAAEYFDIPTEEVHVEFFYNDGIAEFKTLTGRYWCKLTKNLLSVKKGSIRKIDEEQ